MKKAIDIVLIPADEIIDFSITLNKKLGSQEIVLNRINSIPHISLAMTVIDSQQEEKLIAQFNKLKSQFAEFELEIDHTFYHRSTEHLVSGLGIKKTEELMNLHKSACDLLKEFSMEVDPNDNSVFADGNKIDYPLAASWPLDYIKKHSATNFDPHITIGVGDIGIIENIKFKPKALSIYYLGPYCTCHSLMA